MQKEDILAQLTKTTAVVTFEKVDGTKRVMNCTLMRSALPEQMDIYEEMNNPKRDPNPNVIAVWDLDKNDWRSFRIDKVKEISYK